MQFMLALFVAFFQTLIIQKQINLVELFEVHK